MTAFERRLEILIQKLLPWSAGYIDCGVVFSDMKCDLITPAHLIIVSLHPFLLLRPNNSL
jgi:hypothetical protein